MYKRQLIPLLPAVATGAISGAGLTSAVLLRTDLSNETPMGLLPDWRAGHASLTRPAGFGLIWTGAYHANTSLADMLLRNAEVQYGR